MNTPTTEASFAATENSSSNNNIYDEYIIIVRFASAAHLQVWMQSADRQLMVDRVTEFSLDGTLPSYTSFHSLEHWFVTLEDAQMSNTNKSAGAGGALTRPPAKWKMVLVTVVIIYSQSLWIAKVIQKLAPNMNPYAIQLINVALLVLVATYVLFPIVTRPFSFWLTPGVDYADKLRELIPSGVLQTKEKKQNEETTLNTQHDQPNQF